MIFRQREWAKWGAVDPYYGVLSGPELRKRAMTDEQLNRFFLGGEKHVCDVLTRLDRHFPSLKRGKVLDYGCGVGRLVLPFAGRFEQAYGADISPGMLQKAETKTRGLANIHLVQTDGTSFSSVPNDLDLVHSFIVFQHIAPAQGYRIIGNLLGLIGPGGAAALHVIVHRNASATRRAVNFFRKHIWPIHLLANLATGRKAFEPIMQMNTYSLNRIATLMSGAGFESMIAERYGEYLGYESYFIFGRRG